MKMPTNYFSFLDKHNYINLATFRKSGEKMVTPVWFAQDGERLVMTTTSNAGKAKRIRNNPCVEVAPSDQRGKPLGDAIAAQARILDGTAARTAEELLKKRYGWQWTAFGLVARKDARIYLEITAP